MEKVNTYTPENYDRLIRLAMDVLRRDGDEGYASELIANHGLWEEYEKCLDEDCDCFDGEETCHRWADWIALHDTGDE